jgi:hypothetical protein
LESKPCPSCGGILQFRVEPGTRDSRTGPSLYCDNCLYREWGARPSPAPEPSAESHKPDWKLDEYTRRGGQDEIAQITGQIGLGDLMDAWIIRDKKTAAPYDAILNVGQSDYTPPEDAAYAHIPLTEYGTRPAKRHRRDADFAAAVAQLESWVREGKKVFVHCIAGANRSAGVIMAYLMDNGLDYPQALNYVREKRPVAWPHGEISLTLRRFAEDRRSDKRSVRTAADDTASFVAEVDWNEPFEDNYLRIEESGKDIAKYDRGGEFYEAAHPAAERFVRSDILITQAIGQEHYRAQQYPETPPTGQAVNVMAAAGRPYESFTDEEIKHLIQVVNDPEAYGYTEEVAQQLAVRLQKYLNERRRTRQGAKPKTKPDLYTRPMFETGRPEILPFNMNPRDDIKRVDPATAYTQLLSRRGLKVPAPEVYASERYQTALQKAPLVPLDAKDPRSIDRALAFVQQTRGLLIEAGGAEGPPQEYFRVPTQFGSKRVNHVMFATWFAMFSPNTAVEAEETSFVLWQAGQSGSDPGKSGIMSKKDKIINWLQFLKWAGFPHFKQLYQTLEGFDPSDEAYGRRMIALARLPGIQFKVGSFMLALLGDTRSPTLDMHALGYLMQTGKLDVPAGGQWSSLTELAQEANALEKLYAESGDSFAYRERKLVYDRTFEANKKIIGQLTGQMRIKKGEPPPTQRGQDTEKRKVQEYMRRQMEGWNGDTNTFWAWYAKNEYFTTHEPRRSMIHSVFFQSLFPELFTPEALQQRDLVKDMGDPELRTEEQEDRAKYRDYAENLQEMRDIQRPFMTEDKTKLKSVPKVKPVKPKGKPALVPAPSDDFDWETGT